MTVPNGAKACGVSGSTASVRKLKVPENVMGSFRAAANAESSDRLHAAPGYGFLIVRLLFVGADPVGEPQPLGSGRDGPPATVEAIISQFSHCIQTTTSRTGQMQGRRAAGTDRGVQMARDTQPVATSKAERGLQASGVRGSIADRRPTQGHIKPPQEGLVDTKLC